MIKLGDKVRFVNENMQGVVTSLKGNTAGVTIEDDFEIPVLLSEIVRINDILNKPQEDAKPVTHKPQFVKVHNGFHLAFNPITDNQLELLFHNSECSIAQCALYQNKQLIQTFKVEQEQTHSLGRFNMQEISQWPEFMFVITALEDTYKTPALLTRKLKFNPKEFHAAFRHCYFLDTQAYQFRLDETIKTADLQKLKEKDFSEPVNSAAVKLAHTWQKGNNSPDVIDLHLTSAPNLTAAQIVDEQMNTLRKSLDEAYMNNKEHITFIHGVGNHYLKNKILSYLKQQQIVESTMDGDPLKYGAGATTVRFKKR